MTKKSKIIIITTVLSVLALMLILFGAVFCLYKQDVVFVGERENTLNITNEQIINSAGLKKGDSILLIDKDMAINNIERAYPYIKVIQISTVSPIRIEIRIRERYEMYYAYSDTSKLYYVLDEELKVLRISETLPNGLTKIESTILGDSSIDILGITSNTVVCDFLSNENYRSITYNLFFSMINTLNIENANREGIKALVTNVQFAKGYTLKETYDRIIISTNKGFTIDIGKPQIELVDKVNVCFSAIDEFISKGETAGTIKVTYLDNGEERINFIKSDS